MTYDEKKSLYESIMKDVAKIVKKQLNGSSLFENFEDYSVIDFTRLYIAGELNEIWLREFNEANYKQRTKNDFAEFIDKIESISKNPSDVNLFFNTLLTTLKETLKGFEVN